MLLATELSGVHAVQRMNARRKFAGSENPANAATCSMLASGAFKVLGRNGIFDAARDRRERGSFRREAPSQVRSVICSDEATAFMSAPESGMCPQHLIDLACETERGHDIGNQAVAYRLQLGRRVRLARQGACARISRG
jgi:hypothetical protein